MCPHPNQSETMTFTTTLRLDDDLGRFLREAAEAQGLSVNGWLAELVRREQVAAARLRLAADWAAYAQADEVQAVDFAWPALTEAAEAPRRRIDRARKPKGVE